MTPSDFFRRLLLPTVAGLFVAGVVVAQEPKPPAAATDGIEELARGPVHEAFGQPSQFNPEPGETVAKAPPEAVEELPPDQKPEGDDVRWIPGYWHYDDETKDYMWVSGFWRNIPPGRNWVPGYWNTIADGNQWVSGFWANAEAAEAEYLPAPPETLEAGPAGDAPAADNVWMPGTWMWRDTRYLWRPGYWAAGNPNWVWSAPHYEWTPNGYVFVDGYWDYPLQRRGLLFAPVVFGPRLRPGFVYTPSIVIDTGLLTLNLFARPRYQHYYFGDYYAASYATAGIYPWFAYSNSRRGYDPLYAYTNWSYGRTNANWERDQRRAYYDRRDNENARPPRTVAAQRELAKRADAAERQNLVLTRSLADLAAARPSTTVVNNNTTNVKLVKVDAAQVKVQQTNAAEYRKLTAERVKAEQATAGGTARKEPARVKLPVSVSAGTTAKSRVTAPAPPKQPEAAAREPGKAKSSALPNPEDVLKPDFTRPKTGREPMPKTPAGKEPGTPKTPMPKDSKEPKDPAPKVPMKEPREPKEPSPKPPTPKEPREPKNPAPKEPRETKDPTPKNPPKAPPTVTPPAPKSPPVNPPMPKGPAPKPKGNPKDKD